MKIKFLIASLFAVLIVFNSCKKKFDLPPVKADPAVSGYITIDSIYQRFKTYYVTATVSPTKFYRFTGDVNLECTVTADEVSGNIYKSVYVEDATGGLKVNLLNPGGLYTGDKIRINLNNVVLNDYGDVVQLDSIEITKRVKKISSGNIVTPTKISFNQLNASMGFGGIFKYQSRLILLDSVEFVVGDKLQPFADAVNKSSIDRTLMQSYGTGNVVVRSSGYSNFAGSTIPCGKGSLVAIMGQFGSDAQLTLREYKDVKLSSGGCPLVIKSFNDLSITSGGWSTYNVSGNINWTIGSYNGQLYGNISNYVSGNQPCETWLISPALDLSSATNQRFSFQSAYNYSGPALEVLVSTNYTGGNPSLATWVDLGPPLSGGSWNWVSSGVVSLAGYNSPNTRIAFKYTGSSIDGSTWEIDDIAIYTD
jgi:hypothetical protein